MAKKQEKKEEKINTLIGYGDDIQTSFFAGMFGIILLIGTFVFLIVNEIMGLNDVVSIEIAKTWGYRILGLVLMFLGLKMSISIIKTIISAFPHLKSSFTFINTKVVVLMSLITSLVTISVPWLFINFKIFCTIWATIVLLWIKMRSIKRNLKKKFEDEFAQSGKEKYEHFGKMTGQTYKETEETINKAKNIANKIIGKFK